MCSAVPQVRSPQYPQSAVRAAQYAAKDPAVLRRTAYTARSAADFVERTAAQHCVCVRACVCVCVCVCSAISRRWISTSLDLHIEVTLLLEVEFPACCEAASNSSTGCCFTEPSHIYPRSGEHGSCERALLRCPIGRYIHTCNSKVIFNIGHCLLFTSQHSVCSQGVSRIRRLMGPLL